ncbi:hypothetical protein AAMO2058_000781100 [Amorphochlora amoebiformis]
MAKVLYGTMGAVAIGILAIFFGYVLHIFNAFTAFTPDLSCTSVGADVMSTGSEDFTIYRNGIVFVSSGDLYPLFRDGIEAAEHGKILTLDLTAEDLNPTVLEIEGYTKPRLQPHGMYYSNKTNRLLVISHALQLGGSTVEIFEVLNDPIRLKYVESVSSPLFPHGTINDLVEGTSADEIYITKLRQNPIPLKGMAHAHTAWEIIESILDRTVPIFYALTRIVRCSKDSGLWEADIFTKSVREFDRNPTTGAFKYIRDIPAVHCLDNINLDEESGDIIGGIIPSMWSFVRHWGKRSIPSPGGVIFFSKSKGYKSPEILIHDGSVISSTSVAAFWGDKIVLGSAFSTEGVAVCKRMNNTK